MLKAVRQHAERQGLHLSPGFFTGRPVHEDSGQIDYLRDPAAVLFLFQFHFEGYHLPQS